ncbi:hypothetical protein [Alistipes putredinis]|uniref:hypothetical protein n=1 Tax=Alistipes putredinis TaxID=28117 RepID=UPI0039676F05
MTGIITNYLTQHRRLVVPQLGTFVVKVPEGGVVFSELLRRDDGILRGLLVQQGGMNDLEAAGAIDRFVFEVRHALEHEGAYAIEGFGRLTLSPGGAIVFQAAPATSVAAGPVAGESAPEEGNKISSAAASHPASVAASAESVAPRVRSRSEAKASPVIDDGISEPRISVSAKRKPAPYVKGLQYGKLLKTTEGYTYVGSKPRRRIDKFMVIAIVVAVLAVGVIVYGYLRRAKIERLEREYLEQLAPAVPEPVAAGTDGGVEPVPDTNQE